MAGNKKRLYIALYPTAVSRNDEYRYHWGLLVGPKNEDEAFVQGMRYHVKNPLFRGWVYEEVECNARTTPNLLVRILIAKVTDPERLARICQSVPISKSNPSCRTWVRDVLEVIKRDGNAVGTAILDWTGIEHVAKQYALEKTESGRFADVALAEKPKPTFDLIHNREIIS